MILEDNIYATREFEDSYGLKGSGCEKKPAAHEDLST